MAQLPSEFDTSQVPETEADYSALPAGDYICQATDSEMKDTKAGNGQYLQITFEVLDGDHKGRKIWDRLNLVNPNQTAVDIAQRQLASLARSCGVQKVADSSVLHGIPVTLKVKIRKGTDQFDDSNDVVSYKAANPAQASSGSESSPPWESSPPPF